MKWLQSRWELAALLLLAAVVYQPWNSRLLPLTDFGTFLPLLDPGQSLVSQFADVTRYYMGEGRIILFPFLLFVAAGNAFGAWAPGWYWTYFVLNAAVIVLGWHVLRKTGVSRPAAFAGLALWATMSSTPEVWIRPTGEAFALIFFLVAVYAAINFVDAGNWRQRTWIIAACAAGIVFSKELLVVLLPVCWLISRLRYSEAGWHWVPWNRRDTILLATTSAALAVSLSVVAYVVLSAPPGNYASQLGTAGDAARLALRRLEMMMIPTTPRLGTLARLQNDPGWVLLLVLPSILWIRMMIGAIWAAVRRGSTWPIAIGGLWMLLGIVSYLPWPVGDDFYMVPFAFGAMFAVAHGLSCLFSTSAWTMRASLAVTAFILCITSVEARSTVYKYGLRAKINAGIITEISRRPQADVLLAAVPNPSSEVRWGWSTNLSGFGKFVAGTNIRQTRDVTCEDARRALASSRRVVVVSKDRGCGPLSASSVVVSASVPWAQWPWLWKRAHIEGRNYVTASESYAVNR